jgi:hypothetical protein
MVGGGVADGGVGAGGGGGGGGGGGEEEEEEVVVVVVMVVVVVVVVMVGWWWWIGERGEPANGRSVRAAMATGETGDWPGNGRADGASTDGGTRRTAHGGRLDGGRLSCAAAVVRTAPHRTADG